MNTPAHNYATEQRETPASTLATRAERRIIGPPGCGKTTWLTRQVNTAVQENRRVLVLSLTRAAAAEAAGRDLPIPPESVSTIHALCYRALGRPAIADNPDNIKKWNHERPDLALSVQSGDGGGDQLNLSREGDRYMHVWQLCRARMEEPPATGPVRNFINAWENWRRQENLIDFTGMIETVLERRIPPPGGADAIFVDEAQDLSRLEMTLVRQWGDMAGSLTLVGDPDQNLYRWRGTDWGALTEDLPDVTVESATLSQSYRVSRKVHNEAIRWLSRSPIRKLAQYRPTGEAGDFRICAGTFLDPRPLIEDLRRELEQGRDIMILASCAYMMDRTVSALRDAGIPFHNPYRTHNGRWNPLRSSKTATPAARRVSAWLNHSQGDGWTLEDLALWTRVLYAKRTLSQGQAGLKQLAEELGPEYADPIPHERLSEILTPQAIAAGKAGDLDWFESNLLAASRQGAEFSCAIARTGGRPALVQEPRVIVGTIHSVKGGETDTVYLFPDLSTDGMREWLSSPEQQAGVYRLFYVGMTRARHTLTLCQAATGMAVDF